MSNIIAHGFDIDAPSTAPTCTLGVGNLPSGTYRYKVSYVTHYGETLCGPTSTLIVAQNGVRLADIPVRVLGNVIARRIYRSNGGAFLRIAEIPDNRTVVFYDNGLASGDPEPDSSFASSVARELGWIINTRPQVAPVSTVVATSPYTDIDQKTQVALITATGPGLSVRMPAVGIFTGMMITLSNQSLHDVTVHARAGQTINGGATSVLSSLQSLGFIFAGANWSVIEGGGGGGGGGSPQPVAQLRNVVFAGSPTIDVSAVSGTGTFMLLFIQRGSEQIYASGHDPLNKPPFAAGSIALPMQHNDIIMLQLFDGAGPLANMLSETCVKLLRLRFVNNTEQVAFIAPNYAFPMRLLADYGYVSSITNQAQAIGFVSTVTSSLSVQNDGSFTKLITCAANAGVGDIIVFRETSLVLGYGTGPLTTTLGKLGSATGGAVSFANVTGVVNTPCTIYWGDGTFTPYTTGNAIHQYAEDGTYYVEIAGHAAAYGKTLAVTADASSIHQWGGATFVRNQFAANSNRKWPQYIVALDQPNIVGDARSMFDNQQLLQFIINGWNLSSITDLRGFITETQCPRLEIRALTFPSVLSRELFTTNNLTYMVLDGCTFQHNDYENMLRFCGNMVTCELTNCAFTAPTLNLSEMFRECRRMVTLITTGTTIAATDLNTSGMFSECYLLENVDVSWLVGPRLINAANMFYSCSSMVTVNMQGLNFTNCDDMNYMFGYMSRLQTVNWTGVTGTSPSVSCYGMFYDCPQLTSMNLSWMTTMQLRDIAYMFAECPVLTALNISGWSSSILQDANGFIDSANLPPTEYSNVLNVIAPIATASGLTGRSWSLNSQYIVALAQASRNVLTITQGWTINDGGGI